MIKPGQKTRRPTPQSYIRALQAPLAEADRPYVSHLRAYGENVSVGLAELAEVASIANVPVHASHLVGPPEAINTALLDMTSRDISVSFDMYPYLPASTILAMLVLPVEIQKDGLRATLCRLNDPNTRAVLLQTERLNENYLSNVVLSCLPEHLADRAGKTITEAAAGVGKPPGEWTIELLIDTELQVGAHVYRTNLTESELQLILTHPRHFLGSDGIYFGQ